MLCNTGFVIDHKIVHWPSPFPPSYKTFTNLSQPSPWFHCAHRPPGPWTLSDSSALALLPCLSKMKGFSSSALQGPPWREDQGAVQVMMHTVLFIQVTVTQTICHLDTWQLQCHLLSTQASGCPSTAGHQPSTAPWAPEWQHWEGTPCGWHLGVLWC